jgi:hypothetical protein
MSQAVLEPLIEESSTAPAEGRWDRQAKKDLVDLGEPLLRSCHWSSAFNTSSGLHIMRQQTMPIWRDICTQISARITDSLQQGLIDDNQRRSLLFTVMPSRA